MRKIKSCPFCGRIPSGLSYVSTNNGPALVCDGCSADGPPALGKAEQEGPNERKLYPQARAVWNRRAHERQISALPELLKAALETRNVIRNILTDSQLDVRTKCGLKIRRWLKLCEVAIAKASGKEKT